MACARSARLRAVARESACWRWWSVEGGQSGARGDSLACWSRQRPVSSTCHRSGRAVKLCAPELARRSDRGTVRRVAAGGRSGGAGAREEGRVGVASSPWPTSSCCLDADSTKSAHQIVSKGQLVIARRLPCARKSDGHVSRGRDIGLQACVACGPGERGREKRRGRSCAEGFARRG